MRHTNGIPTEPIGSIPRPPVLIDGVTAFDAGEINRRDLDALFEDALQDTIQRLEGTGSPVLTDGEQTKSSFVTYPLEGILGLNPNGVEIGFKDEHTRQLPLLTRGPFRYGTYARKYLERARQYTRLPVKQAVISASALSLLYPADGIADYSRKAFLEDLVNEVEADIRGCFEAGAHNVQIDFTEGRLSLKLDPSKNLLREFVNLNNKVLRRFSPEYRKRIGIHTCPGGDQDSTHSADVPYTELLPDLFKLQAGNFYVQLASESDRTGVYEAIRDHAWDDQRIFVGVTDPIDPRVETPEEVKDRVLEAAEYIPWNRLGTTDDCGFSPFGDDVSTSRDTAFEKIRARVEGTRLASEALKR